MEGVVVVERREEWCASKHTCRQRGKAHTKKGTICPSCTYPPMPTNSQLYTRAGNKERKRERKKKKSWSTDSARRRGEASGKEREKKRKDEG